MMILYWYSSILVGQFVLTNETGTDNGFLGTNFHVKYFDTLCFDPGFERYAIAIYCLWLSVFFPALFSVQLWSYEEEKIGRHKERTTCSKESESRRICPASTS